jgi:cell division transport system permease protein
VQAALFSLGRLYRAPIGSLLTAAVIGIALALPSSLYLLVDNLQQLGRSWDGSASLSLFLKQSARRETAQGLADRLRTWPEVDSLRLISPEEALEEFRRLSGFGDALDALEENPLPYVLTLQPATDHAAPDAAKRLLERLQRLPEVDLAQLDLQWVKRFATMMEIAQRGIVILGALLALAVLLVIGNTIRLEIFNRREEIEVAKLIGATNGFIRRPFLYGGIWYGLLGASLAWILVETAFAQIRGPVQRLSALYQSQFSLQTFTLEEGLALLLLGTLLGLLGSWLAVGRHLSSIEPA